MNIQNRPNLSQVESLGQPGLPVQNTRDPISNMIRDPKGADVDFDELAMCLARLGRFSGHGNRWISVAAHSRVVCDEALALLDTDMYDVGDGFSEVERWEIVMAALLHDVHEAFIGDTTRPMLDYYQDRCPEFAEARDDLATSIDEAVFAAVGIELPMKPWALDVVRDADDKVGRIEAMHVGITDATGMTPQEKLIALRIERECTATFAEDASRFANMVRQIAGILTDARAIEKKRSTATRPPRLART